MAKNELEKEKLRMKRTLKVQDPRW